MGGGGKVDGTRGIREGGGRERKGEGGTLLNLADHSPLELRRVVCFRVFTVCLPATGHQFYTSSFRPHGERDYGMHAATLRWCLLLPQWV